MAPWRNTEAGYGVVTKTLHWCTAVAVAAPFVIGYLIDDDGRGRGRGRGRGGDDGASGSGGSRHDLLVSSGRGRGGDDLELGFGAGDDRLATVHVLLGLTILALTLVRLVWRRATALPAWATTLSERERVLASWTERALYLCLVVVPLTGLVLVLGSDGSDDLLGLHVAAHFGFFVALTLHLGLVLKHTAVRRDRLLSRMT